MPSIRRNEYDVTNKIKVSDPSAVQQEVIDLAKANYDDANEKVLRDLFTLFSALFNGQYPNYSAYDTVYHDQQHSLDVTLCAARHFIGHDNASDLKFGFQGFVTGIATALFHDAGYIRHQQDKEVNGAVYTKTHVSRGAEFINTHVNKIIGNAAADIAARIVHFTGYEIPYDRIAIKNHQEKLIGTMVASADILAQMADRCYIEKCRDRLYPEFVLGGMTINANKQDFMIYQSAHDMLYKTPEFYHVTTKNKLNKTFDKAYQFLDAFFGGDNPYIASADNNIAYLEAAIEAQDLSRLRRRPPKNQAIEKFPFDEIYQKEKLLHIQSLASSMQQSGKDSYLNFT